MIRLHNSDSVPIVDPGSRVPEVKWLDLWPLGAIADELAHKDHKLLLTITP